MLLFYKAFFPTVWLLFCIYWRLRATNTKTTQRIEPVSSASCASPSGSSPSRFSSSHPNTSRCLGSTTGFGTSASCIFWLGAAITVAGLLFAVWARAYLGRNWSSAVTIKQDHQLITTGPYAIVRHPIYTGILAGFLGMAIAIAQLSGFHGHRPFLPRVLAQTPQGRAIHALPVRRGLRDYARHTSALVPYLF